MGDSFPALRRRLFFGGGMVVEMKSQRIADVKVPVVPVVIAGEFRVLVLDIQRVQRAVKIAIIPDQRIVGPAIDSNARQTSGVAR